MLVMIDQAKTHRIAQSEDKKELKYAVNQYKTLRKNLYSLFDFLTFIVTISLFIIIIFLFISMLLTYYMIFLKVLKLFEYLEMDQTFFFCLIDIIEFVFLVIMLLMLAFGIYNYIIKPLLESSQKLSPDNYLFKGFATHLSQPFLIIISSMLVVYSIKLVFTLFYTVYNYSFAKNIDSLYECVIIIFLVFFVIITIGILMRIEKSIMK
jgi:hypothetical protein